MKQKIKSLQTTVVFAALAVVIGLIVGALTTVFGRVLIAITDYRMMHTVYLLPFLAISGLIIVYSYQRYGKNTDQGMGLVFAVAHGEAEAIPKRMIPLVMLGTWLTHLFGGSAGREGVAVQIGAVVGDAASRRLPYPDIGKTLLVAGMAAGFAGLFQTPLAGIFFALEVLVVGHLKLRALLPTTIAALTASATSHALGLEKFTAVIMSPEHLTLTTAGQVMILGLAFGLVGGFFAFGLKHAKQWAGRLFANPYHRIVIIGAVSTLFLLVLHMGRYSGLGTNLISASFNSGPIFVYDWLFKLLLTIIVLAAGFQGGEVTPLFAIGATLGIALAPLIGLPLTFAAALGYVSVFAAATNTWIGPIFIGAEVFGFEFIPFFFLAVVIAYTFNGNQTIYSGQKTVKEN